ncbi:MAG: hypothetical protein JWL69_1484 [Phycisphaerales bacterium]|jgi:hypothetical protein|nr:hypothetical protein [Phycisphaerales bacterium]MDB5355303.1 hypothetical protein [Phycisphaerales bacterium]
MTIIAATLDRIKADPLAVLGRAGHSRHNDNARNMIPPPRVFSSYPVPEKSECTNETCSPSASYC